VSLTRGSKSAVGENRERGRGLTGGYDEMARRRIQGDEEEEEGKEDGGSWPEVEEERVVEQEATPSRFARAAQHNIAAT